MRTQTPSSTVRCPCTLFGPAARLAEYTTPIREGIADGSAKLPKDLPQRFFEVFVDFDVLVVAEEAMGEVGELGDVGVLRVVFPAWREGEVGRVLLGGGGFSRGGG